MEEKYNMLITNLLIRVTILEDILISNKMCT